MKKIAICLMATGLLLTFQPLQAKAVTGEPVTSSAITTGEDVVDQKVVDALMLRLTEIKEMDHSSLNSKEKRALRKEVRDIQNNLEHPGVYISVGGAILIILLLVIIF